MLGSSYPLVCAHMRTLGLCNCILISGTYCSSYRMVVLQLSGILLQSSSMALIFLSLCVRVFLFLSGFIITVYGSMFNWCAHFLQLSSRKLGKIWLCIICWRLCLGLIACLMELRIICQGQLYFDLPSISNLEVPYKWLDVYMCTAFQFLVSTGENILVNLIVGDWYWYIVPC